jgi:phosphate transport system substrate-binding protein
MTDIEMAETAEQVEGSFGYGSLAQLLIERRRLKAIALDGVEPTPENAASGRYKAVKRHYLVVAADVKGCPARFVDFARSAEAWSFLRGFGWRPIENAGRP